jgi:hypothetical protein
MATTNAPAELAGSAGLRGQSVTLQCAHCGALVGVLALPPLPAFSSLSFEARTVLKPVAGLVARTAPAVAPALQAWLLDGSAVELLAFSADALRPAITCAACTMTRAPLALA